MKTYYLVLFLFFSTLSSSLLSSVNVIGGNDASEKIKTSVVSLLVESQGKLEFACTGSVIKKNIVLTATHCLAQTFDGDMFISWGKEALNGPRVRVSKFKFHHHNYFRKPPTDPLENRDIALLMTEEDLPLVPVMIGNPSDLRRGDTIIQAGYGNSEPNPRPAPRTYGVLYELNSSTVDVVSTRSVRINESESRRIDEGDSGGPLFVEKQNQTLELHGIVSQGDIGFNSDGSLSYNSLYTHPYFFIKWMNCALPSDSQVTFSGKLEEQVDCDGQSFLPFHLINDWVEKQCEEQRPGHMMHKRYGCWPTTKESCENSRRTYWDEATQSCFPK